eukprot:1137803-Pelagomonas_calceolata.AAC.2
MFACCVNSIRLYVPSPHSYAEPAISSLRPLAEQVDRQRAPYLHFVLMEKQADNGRQVAQHCAAFWTNGVRWLTAFLFHHICFNPWLMSGDMQQLVGLGVGTAAVLGTYRFVKRQPRATHHTRSAQSLSRLVVAAIRRKAFNPELDGKP